MLEAHRTAQALESQKGASAAPSTGRALAFARQIPWPVAAAAVLGLGELVLHFAFAHRAPRPDDWAKARATAAAWRKEGDLVAVAPYWAEPIARWKLGDVLMPIHDVARPDASRYAHAVELSAMGARDPELAGWTVERQERVGPVVVRRLAQPSPPEIHYVFTSHLAPPYAEVFHVSGGTTTPCGYTTSAQVSAGGLGGNPTFPAARFACPGGRDAFVGLTVIDDNNERPRLCIWAMPGQNGEIVVRFADVPLGQEIVGHTGEHWLYERDATGSFSFRVFVDGEDKGRVVHDDGVGWARFRIVAGGPPGRTGSVEFRLTATGGPRPACFEADVRTPRGAP